MKSKFLWRAIPLVIAAQGGWAAQNLVGNSEFEAGTTGWTSTRSMLTTDSRAAFSGLSGLRMSVGTASDWCPYGAVYPLDVTSLVNGTMYEFGARTRLEADAATPVGTVANARLGLIRNGASPIWLDGYSNYSYAYPDRWTRLFGVYKADFLPTDKVQLCIGNAKTAAGVIKTTYLDGVFVRPLTTAEIGYQPPASLDREALVQADGNRLVVGSARASFLLKGINVYGYNNGNDVPGTELAIDSFGLKNHDENSFREIAGLGFNTVRFLMSYVLLEDANNPGVYKDEGWALLDRAIGWAKDNNLRLILDMHEPPGGIQLPTKIDISNQPALKTRLENLWVAIAQRYRNEPAVLAYDLVNEPYMDNWFGYVPRLIDKIRAVDPDHLILVEESFHPNDRTQGRFYPLPYANIIYDSHYYDTYGSTVDTVPYSGSAAFFQTDLIDSFSNFYNPATASFVAPLNVGEYGVVHQKFAGEQNLGAEQWLRDMTAAMDQHGLNRVLFAYHETRFGLYSGWQTYPGESTQTNTGMLALLPELNRSEPLPLPVASVDMAAALSRNLASATTGQALTYTFGASNLGNTAADATVTLTLPAAAQIAAVPVGCSTAGTVLTCSKAALGSAISASWSVSVSYATAGTWTATTAVSAGGVVADGNAANNSTSASVTVSAPTTGNADIALTTFKVSGTPKVGAAFGFNFVLINNGPTTANNVTFTLPLPAGVTKATGGAAECTAASAGQIVCSFGSLTKGTSRNRYVYVKPAAKGAISFTGTAASNNPDSVPTNNANTLAVTVN